MLFKIVNEQILCKTFMSIYFRAVQVLLIANFMDMVKMMDLSCMSTHTRQIYIVYN